MKKADLIITINGKGNFTQLEAPVIQWPAGMEGFEPIVKDSLDSDHSPLSGKRVFRFRFVSAKPGNYVLPAVSFSFFKPDSNNYKTITTPLLNVSVSNKEKTIQEIVQTEGKLSNYRDRWKWWPAGIIGVVIIATIVYRFRKTRKVIKLPQVEENTNTAISIAGILKPAYIFSEADDKIFYSVLRNCIWGFFSQHFGLSGSKMNKSSLAMIMEQEKS